MESIEEMQNPAIYITQKSSFTKKTSHKKPGSSRLPGNIILNFKDQKVKLTPVPM